MFNFSQQIDFILQIQMTTQDQNNQVIILNF